MCVWGEGGGRRGGTRKLPYKLTVMKMPIAFLLWFSLRKLLSWNDNLHTCSNYEIWHWITLPFLFIGANILIMNLKIEKMWLRKAEEFKMNLNSSDPKSHCSPSLLLLPAELICKARIGKIHKLLIVVSFQNLEISRNYSVWKLDHITY